MAVYRNVQGRASRHPKWAARGDPRLSRAVSRARRQYPDCKRAIRIETVIGLASVVATTTEVTNLGATSNSSARIVVITALGIADSTSTACRARPVRPRAHARKNPNEAG